MYSKLLQIEITLLVIHCMACFVLYNPLMLITVGVCRLPRLIMACFILIFLSKFEIETKKKWNNYENIIRLVTTILMPLFSLGI